MFQLLTYSKSLFVTEDKQKVVWDDYEQWNEPILLRVYAKGGPEKIGSRPSQTDGPHPSKK